MDTNSSLTPMIERTHKKQKLIWIYLIQIRPSHKKMKREVSGVKHHINEFNIILPIPPEFKKIQS